MKILLLGTGLQGKAALHDLANSPDVREVIAADADLAELQTYTAQLGTPKVRPVGLDVRDHRRVTSLMREVDAVVSLLPQNFRLEIVKLALEVGVHFVETSYALPEYKAFGEIAKQKGVAILPEFGLDPGIDLVLAGKAISELDEVHELQAYGTGVPEPAASYNPLRYKISWTFAGVLNAYQRPARVLRDGVVVDLFASEIFDPVNMHQRTVEGIGELEAYPNGDAVKYLDILGVRESIRSTTRWTLRYPGHAAFWKKMVDLGFLGEEQVKVGDQRVSPWQFVHDLLEPQLQYKDDERDVAALVVDAAGTRDGQPVRVIYTMTDFRDLETGLLAMQRTVGYTASVGAQMLARGDVAKRGLLAPSRDLPADIVLAELEKRGIRVKREEIVGQQGS